VNDDDDDSNTLHEINSIILSTYIKLSPLGQGL